MPPFLTIPFSKQELLAQQHQAGEDFRKAPYYLTEGYIYSDTYIPITGQALHAAIDYYVPYGAAIYSPINGYVSASYNIQRARNEDGTIRAYEGKKSTYGLGYCVQLIDPMRKLFLLYGHLSYISRGVPFLPPFSNEEGELFAKGFNLTTEHLENLASLERLKPVRKGDYLGDVGVSGIYFIDSLPKVTEKPRERIDQHEFEYYGYPHLHRNTYTRSETGEKQTPIDPYDIYGGFEEYPDLTRPECKLGDNHLMLVDTAGLPKCVDE